MGEYFVESKNTRWSFIPGIVQEVRPPGSHAGERGTGSQAETLRCTRLACRRIRKIYPAPARLLDRGGWFCRLFDDARRVGVVVLENKFIGQDKDQLQLKFLHVSRTYRGQGQGRRLFQLAQAVAREKGARRLYISATPSEHTINFYLGLGSRVSQELDPELFELEPEDIHLEAEV